LIEKGIILFNPVPAVIPEIALPAGLDGSHENPIWEGIEVDNCDDGTFFVFTCDKMFP